MRGVSRLVGSGSRASNRAGANAASVAVDRVARGAGEVLAGIACRLADGRAPAPGHRRTARPGHAVRIEADRGGAARPTDLPAEARAPSVRPSTVRPSTVRCGVHTSTGAGRVERRGEDEGRGGGVHRGAGATGKREPGSGALTAAPEQGIGVD